MAKKKKSVKLMKKGIKKAAPKAVKKLAKKPAKKVLAKKSAQKPMKKAVGKKSKSLGAKQSTGKKASPSMQKKNGDWGQLLTPLDDRLVLQVEEAERRTPGGLYIPDTASVSGHYKGVVLAVGRGHKNKKGQIRPMDVKPGDRVLFDQYAGSKMVVAETDIRILRESEVLGIVE